MGGQRRERSIGRSIRCWRCENGRPVWTAARHGSHFSLPSSCRTRNAAPADSSFPSRQTSTQKHPEAFFSCRAPLQEEDFRRMEEWLASDKTNQCENDDRPLIDDAAVYSLVLDGSERSLQILSRMVEAERTCTGSSETIVGDTLENAKTLSTEANRIGQGWSRTRSRLQSVYRLSSCLPNGVQTAL
jgi:hypothetical protein